MKQKALIILTLLSIIGLKSYAQDVENEMQYRTAVELVFDLGKDLSLNLEPQFRFDEDFSLDRYQLNGELEYDFLKYLTGGVSYRFIVNPRDNKDTEVYQRYAFSLIAKEKFGDFTPAFRLRYSNDADDEVFDKKYLRYKLGVKYDIPNCKITPFVAAEIFQELNENELYKMRYSTGVKYKIKKRNYLKLNYRFDYYNQEYLNKHIIKLAYQYKF